MDQKGLGHPARSREAHRESDEEPHRESDEEPNRASDRAPNPESNRQSSWQSHWESSRQSNRESSRQSNREASRRSNPHGSPQSNADASLQSNLQSNWEAKRTSSEESEQLSNKREPTASTRGFTPVGGDMSFEIVERRPVVSGALARGAASEDPDSELVARWQAGDGQAFELLVRRHEQRVFRLLLRMMGSREEAEDVAQETFLRLHRYGHRFRSEALFSTFVYRVAINAALNRRRSLGRARDRHSKLEVRQAAGDDLPQTPRDPEDAAIGAETSARVRRAIDRLAPALRFPVVLYDIEGLPYGEIARVLGIREGTVKSRIHRARQALRSELRGLVGRGSEGAPS